MMPRAFSSGVSDASFVSTPRGLNEPVRCSSSAFRNASGASVRQERSGVRWSLPRITSAARSTSARSTIARSYDLHHNGPVESMERRPVRLVVRDDLERSRLTVFFRLFLAIPLFLWVVLRGIAAFVVGFVNWLAVLIQAEVPDSLHDFVASYIRYSTQVGAYVFLAANPYPWFRVQQDYPVDVEIEPPVRQGRWGGFFRLLLAIPALLLATVLGGGFATGSSGQSSATASSGDQEAFWLNASSVGGVAAAAALLAWFAFIARGNAPRGLRDLIAFTLGYAAQAGAYLFLLTPRYPTSDPALAEPYSELPEHPVRIVVNDDLERPRLTVLFRLFLAIPHFIWLALWSIAA